MKKNILHFSLAFGIVFVVVITVMAFESGNFFQAQFGSSAAGKPAWCIKKCPAGSMSVYPFEDENGNPICEFINAPSPGTGDSNTSSNSGGGGASGGGKSGIPGGSGSKNFFGFDPTKPVKKQGIDNGKDPFRSMTLKVPKLLPLSPLRTKEPDSRDNGTGTSGRKGDRVVGSGGNQGRSGTGGNGPSVPVDPSGAGKKPSEENQDVWATCECNAATVEVSFDPQTGNIGTGSPLALNCPTEYGDTWDYQLDSNSVVHVGHTEKTKCDAEWACPDDFEFNWAYYNKNCPKWWNSEKLLADRKKECAGETVEKIDPAMEEFCSAAAPFFKKDVENAKKKIPSCEELKKNP